MAVHRLGILSNKKLSVIKEQTQEILKKLLETPPTEDIVRIRVIDK